MIEFLIFYDMVSLIFVCFRILIKVALEECQGSIVIVKVIAGGVVIDNLVVL